MTLGLWLTEDHLSDVDPLIRFFNYEGRLKEGNPALCQLLSIEIHLARFKTPDAVSSAPYGLYVFPRDRKWHTNRTLVCTGDSAQTFFKTLPDMMRYGRAIDKTFNEAGVETVWDIDWELRMKIMEWKLKDRDPSLYRRLAVRVRSILHQISGVCNEFDIEWERAQRLIENMTFAELQKKEKDNGKSSLCNQQQRDDSSGGGRDQPDQRETGA